MSLNSALLEGSRGNVLDGNNAHFAENATTVVIGAGVERGQPVLIP